MRPARSAGSALILCGMVLWAGQAVAGGEPERGEALFDLLLSIEEEAGETADRAVPAIPFPLSALRERITRRGAGAFVKTLIPARSDGTEPGDSTGPRILLSGVAGTADAGARLQIAGRLFIAYQPADAVLEIISFNDTTRRFEFQMVEDYAPGKTPRLRSADRDFCVSCHQSGGPLTPGLATQRRGHPSLQAFERRCGACHAGAGAEDATPFLSGSWREQLAGIAGCAPQITARLTSTHPPKLSGEAWRGSRDFALIQRFATFLAAGKAPDTAPCLHR